jgi:hypothetical protein
MLQKIKMIHLMIEKKKKIRKNKIEINRKLNIITKKINNKKIINNIIIIKN